MKKISKTPLAAAMGVAVISAFVINTAQADANPFGMSELSQGYMQLAEAGKAGEMACGAMMSQPKMPEGACAGAKHIEGVVHPEDKPAEAKCGNMMDGDKMKKGMESACGAMMKGHEGACGTMPAGEKAKEGACGGMMKMPEGKCGAQCSDKMKQCTDAKTKEGACGAMMKGCGEGMAGCSEMMKGKEGACGAKADAAKSPAASATPVPPPVIIHPPQ
jgi:uncharacterized low-complexity protein